MVMVIALVVAIVAVAALVVRESLHRREIARLTAFLEKATAASSRSHELASVGAIVSDLAQELKGPLQGVLGNTELMLMSAEREHNSEELHEIRQNAARAAGIVHNLLAFTNTENLQRNWHDVNEIVSRAADVCRTEAGARRLKVDLKLPPRLPLVYVDGRQLEKVFSTFIGRAAKSRLGRHETASTNVVVTIALAAQPDDRLLIDIDDDGAGVPTGAESPGDLTACARIVEAHGGILKIDDRPRSHHVHLEFPITAEVAREGARLPESSPPETPDMIATADAKPVS